MVWVWTLGGLFVSALFAGASILDKIDDIQDDSQKSMINLGSFTLIALGAGAMWYLTREKKK